MPNKPSMGRRLTPPRPGAKADHATFVDGTTWFLHPGGNPFGTAMDIATGLGFVEGTGLVPPAGAGRAQAGSVVAPVRPITRSRWTLTPSTRPKPANRVSMDVPP